MMRSRSDVSSRSTKQSSTVTITDAEFGAITCVRNPRSKYVRIRVNSIGSVSATLPLRAPLYLVERLLESSREELRSIISSQSSKRVVYVDGVRIGRSHKLSLRYAGRPEPICRVHNQIIDVVLPHGYSGSEAEQAFVSTHVRKALKIEAMAYLPRRLRYLAQTFGFDYEKIRYGNQKGRWGSCSSTGTISLNVALMNTSLEVIDYVLIHELAHTRHMNHSQAFWSLVESCMPDFKTHRKTLKSMSPIC